MIRKVVLPISLLIGSVVFIGYYYYFSNITNLSLISQIRFVDPKAISIEAHGVLQLPNQYSGHIVFNIPYVGEIVAHVKGDKKQKFIIEKLETNSAKKRNTIQSLIAKNIKKENIISEKSLTELAQDNKNNAFQHSIIKKRYGRNYTFSGTLTDPTAPLSHHTKIPYKGLIILYCMPGLYNQKLIQTCNTKGETNFLLKEKAPLSIKFYGTTMLIPYTP